MRYFRTWAAIGVSAVVFATPSLAGQPGRAAAVASPQNAPSRQPNQADVEAQLARMLEELKRENARRGIASDRSEAPKPDTSARTPAKPVETKSETTKSDLATADRTKPTPPAPPPTILTVEMAPVTDVPVTPPLVVAPPPVTIVAPLPVVSVAPPVAVVAPVVPPAAPSVAPPPPPPPAPEIAPVAAPIVPSGVRTPLPAIEGFVAADVQAFLGAPSTVQQGPAGSLMWHYLTPAGRQFVYFIDGVATVTPPRASGNVRPVAPPRQAPGVQGACEGVTGTTGLKTVAVINPDSPVFIEAKFRTQPLTLLAVKKTAEVVSAEGPWYLIRFNDERWGRRVGYIHCSDVVRQDN